jgi:hypothetical protein
MFNQIVKSIIIIILCINISFQGASQIDNSQTIKNLLSTEGVIVIPKTKNYADYIQNNKLGMMIIERIRQIIQKDVTPYAFEAVYKMDGSNTEDYTFSKGEIIIEVDYFINLKKSEGSATITLQVFSNNTNKLISNDIYTSNNLLTTNKEELINKALADFEMKYYSISRIKSYYEDIIVNGKEIILDIKIDDSSLISLNSKFTDLTLAEILNQWVSRNATKGRFTSSPNGQKNMGYNVYVPLIEGDKILTVSDWVKSLRKHLKNVYNIKTTISVINWKSKFVINII